MPIEAYAVSPADLVTVLRERATKEVEFLAEDVPSERLRGIVVDVGRAWEVICEQARRADAAMIVIGAHGYGNIDRLLGTTAARVVNHADRSVVVVRAPERVLGS